MASTPIKAVIPAAGLGTRFLPATKVVPKELLPVVDRPLIQYAIDEARAAGIKEFIFVTSRGKGALEDYFDHSHELENTLHKAGKNDLLELLRHTNMESGAIAYIRQHKAMGLGHAVWCARRLIHNEPFAVVLTDDVVMGEPPCLQQMIEAYQETGGTMVATMEVPLEKTKSYGVLDVAEDMGAYKNRVLSLAEGIPGEAERLVRYVSTHDLVKPSDIGSSFAQQAAQREERGIALAPVLLVLSGVAMITKYVGLARGEMDMYLMGGVGIAVSMVALPFLRKLVMVK